MRLPLSVLCLVAGLAGPALSADIARLEWGSFIIEADSSEGWATYKSTSSDDGRTLRMTFAPFEAKADGATMEAHASLSGHYDVVQPGYDSFSHCTVTIEGHVIKSSAAVAKLLVKVGAVEKVIEWPQGQSASEKFSREIEIVLPQAGRLPDPFMVSVEAHAQKTGQSDAAYVSINTLTITARSAQVASN